MFAPTTVCYTVKNLVGISHHIWCAHLVPLSTCTKLGVNTPPKYTVGQTHQNLWAIHTYCGVM